MEDNTCSYVYRPCQLTIQKVTKRTIVTKEYDDEGRLVKETTEEILEEPENNYPQTTYTTVPEPPFTAK